MSRPSKKGKLPPFVPLFKATMKTPAWAVLPHGAKALYVLLMWQYNTHLQNHVFLSTRDAERKLGSSRRYVSLWFQALEHYGFIVMLNPGGPGVDGQGKAPHYRLTECWYAGKAPTRDFEAWERSIRVEEKGAEKNQGAWGTKWCQCGAQK